MVKRQEEIEIVISNMGASRCAGLAFITFFNVEVAPSLTLTLNP